MRSIRQQPRCRVGSTALPRCPRAVQATVRNTCNPRSNSNSNSNSRGNHVDPSRKEKEVYLGLSHPLPGQWASVPINAWVGVKPTFSTNSLRNNAAVIDDPGRAPTFLRSAILDLTCSPYSGASGMRHSFSPVAALAWHNKARHSKINALPRSRCEASSWDDVHKRRE